MHERLRIAIVGAGPIGLEAALCAVQAGFDVHVYERGRVADNLQAWGHVRLFSPFGLNTSQRGRAALAKSSPGALPEDDALLSGLEFAERYVVPLSKLPELSGRIHEGVEVRAIGRSRAWKRDFIGQPERGKDPFRLLLFDGEVERDVAAEVVFDCSGTYPHHNWIGAGGGPCVGETAVLDSRDYQIPDILGKGRQRFAGKRTLVMGSGYSAATAVVSLSQLAETEPGTRVLWLTRGNRAEPMEPIEDDPLVGRDTLTRTANQLAIGSDSVVDWRPNSTVREIERRRRKFVAAIESSVNDNGRPLEADRSHIEVETVDRIIANVGYRPNRSLYEELQVHECYATGGPMKLAAALLGETGADCLNQTSPGAEMLRSPEPDFFILGAKSYGRDSRFLIKVGLEQIEQVFSLLPSPNSASNERPSQVVESIATEGA